MKKKMHGIGKKLMSSIVAMTMAMEFAPGMALAANVAVSENLVTSLAELYDGDTERARQELEALYEAGIINENGDMVELDIREDGEPVSLDDITARINAKDAVGNLTVNGHAASQEQLAKIAATKNALEIAKMLAQDIEITDEHVENLESLIQGIGDGSIDLDAAIESGTLSVPNKSNARRNAPLRGTPAESDFPATKTGEGEVTLTDAENGIYTDSLIDGATYDANYNFTLFNPKNKTYYTDSQYEGIVSNGVITLSCADTAAAGDTLTVTATLEKAQKVPVSFDWAAAAGSIGLTGTTNGTVTWDVGETGEKTFTVNVAEKGDELWDGERTFVMNVSNLKNAVLPDNTFAWSKVIFVSASDKDSMQIWYDQAEVPGSSSKQGSYGEPLTWRNHELHTENRNMYFSTSKLIENMPADSRVRLIMTLSGSIPNNQRIYTYTFADDEEWADFNGSSAYLYIENPVDSKQLTLNLNSSAGKSQLIKELKASQVRDYIGEGKSTISANLCYYFYHGNDMQHSECSVYITGRGGAFINRLPYITDIVLQAMPPVTPTDVSLPAGTYYSGQIVPVTVTFDHYVTVTEEATLTINGVACHPLESEGTITQKLTFGYTVKTVDSGSVNVSAISDVDGLDPGANFTGQSFGTDENVKLVSAVKYASLAMEDVKYGISDGDPTEQEMTVLIPFKAGASLEWINSESGDCTINGRGFEMTVPDYGKVTIMEYLNGAYFSYNNGKTRYPVYVVRSNDGSETPVALVTRLCSPENETNYLRLDTLNLFMDMLTVGIEDSTTYLDTWENKKTDAKGFAYFDGIDKAYSNVTYKAAAPVVVGSNYSFYTKCGVPFKADQYISSGDMVFVDSYQKTASAEKIEGSTYQLTDTMINIGNDTQDVYWVVKSYTAKNNIFKNGNFALSNDEDSSWRYGEKSGWEANLNGAYVISSGQQDITTKYSQTADLTNFFEESELDSESLVLSGNVDMTPPYNSTGLVYAVAIFRDASNQVTGTWTFVNADSLSESTSFSSEFTVPSGSRTATIVLRGYSDVYWASEVGPRFDNIYITKKGDEDVAITDNRFTASSIYNTDVTAKYGKITVPKNENGMIKVEKDGDSIYLTGVPNVAGYKAKFTVKDANGNEIPVTNSSFTMPASNVTVTAVFEKTPPTYYSQSWRLSMEDYIFDGTAHEPTITGTMYGDVTYTYYNDDTNEVLSAAPIEPGNYRVRVFAEGGTRYYSRKQEVSYSILSPFDKDGMADIAPFKKNDIIPTADGKVFAGWFTDSTCTTPYTANSGKAYAKFIDNKILTVKAQISGGTTANSEKTSIRFITSVDSLKYQNIGFKITFNGKTIDQKLTKVYSTLLASGKKVNPGVFSEESHYMGAFTLNNIPKNAFDKEFTVTPYYTTEDGTVVEGETKFYTIAKMIK